MKLGFSMTKTILLIALISVFGFFLRLVDYDTVPPINENFDEVHYAWGGGTWLTEGVPRSWSFYDSYTKFTTLDKYGGEWKIVEPILEKPPLFFWLIGAIVVAFGPDNVFEVEHSLFRVLPLTLSLLSIFLTGFLALRVFGRNVAVVAALVYATVPTIVMANRLAVTESLLTPFILFMGILFTFNFKDKRKALYGVLSVGILAFLTALTKHVGLFLGIAAGAFYFSTKQYKASIVALCGMAAGVGVFVFIGWIYDFGLFMSLAKDVRVNTLSGLPQLISVIFAYPGVSAKNRMFFDESILLGMILLFSSPFIFREQLSKVDKNIFGFLIIPILFIVAIVFGQTGAGPFDYFVIYIYPLFPFAIILLSRFLVSVLEKDNILASLLFVTILGSGALRFILQIFPREYHHHWQNLFLLLLLSTLGFYLLLKKYWRPWLLLLFAVFIAVNVFAVINLRNTYEPSVRVLQNVYGSFNE